MMEPTISFGCVYGPLLKQGGRKRKRGEREEGGKRGEREESDEDRGRLGSLLTTVPVPVQ
jgi:hypothetical protein